MPLPAAEGEGMKVPRTIENLQQALQREWFIDETTRLGPLLQFDMFIDGECYVTICAASKTKCIAMAYAAAKAFEEGGE